MRKAVSLVLIALVAVSLGCISSDSSAQKDALAKCLTEKGVKMYGAFWCSHCQNQKNEFGDSFQYIDYVECDPRGTNANPQACAAAGIEGYPTWIINGAKYSGEQSLNDLAKLANCSVG